MTRLSLTCLPLALLALAACEIYPPTAKPDYTIHVVSTPKGDVAIPPACPSWTTETTNPYDNQPNPQFGCANARNLALTAERPSDLVRGRNLGPQRAVTAVGAIRRYDNDQTRGMIDPDTNPDSSASVTTSSAAASGLSGDITGGAGAASSSSASTPAAGP